jgi:hypothetical protein
MPVMYAAGTIYTLRNTKSMSSLLKRPLEGVIMYLECMCPAEAFNGTAPSTGPLRQPHGPVMYAAGTIYTLRNTKSMSSLLKRPLEGIIMYLECMCPTEAFDSTAAVNGPPINPVGTLCMPQSPYMHSEIPGPCWTSRHGPLEGTLMYCDCI